MRVSPVRSLMLQCISGPQRCPTSNGANLNKPAGNEYKKLAIRCFGMKLARY